MRRAFVASGQLHDASEPQPVVEQYGALAWRRSPTKGLRILLVTSRERKLWIVPKGWPIAGYCPHRTAAREALEEAGVFGAVSSKPCGSYSYTKVLADEQAVPCRVTVYPLRVKASLVDWSESKQRRRRWFSLAEATDAVSEPSLARLLSKVAVEWSGEGGPHGL